MNRPAPFEYPFPDNHGRKSKSSLPFAYTQLLSIVRQIHIGSLVLALLLLCCQSYIFLGVSFVVVFSFQTHAFRDMSYVVNKIHKRFFPSFANLDPTPSVILVLLKMWVIASLAHLYPNQILSRVASSVNSASISDESPRVLSVKTPARNHSPGLHMRKLSGRFSPALAFNFVIPTITASSNNTNNGEPSKFHAYAGNRQWGRIGINHDRNLLLGPEPERCNKHQFGSLYYSGVGA